MRRVLAISLAILVVTIAARGVVAQDSDQAVSDRLLEILKDRQIISTDEYGELKALAATMQENDVEQRLNEIDRSIADYLAKEGEGEGASVSHQVGTGFGFATGDGLFSLWLGGLFQFGYTGFDRDDLRDTNNFSVFRNRIQMNGKAFDKNLDYKVQLETASGVTLLDAFVNWDICDWAEVKAGQFKVPYGRQSLTSAGKLQFIERTIVDGAFSFGRDVGVMLHDTMPVQEDGDATVEYSFGLFNGEGANVNANDNNWFMWALRFGVYPMGVVTYSEGRAPADPDPKFGIAGSYVSEKGRPFGTEVETTAWEFDGVVTWEGLYVTGEYFQNEVDPSGGSSVDTDGWYVQAGYMVPNSDIEVLGRYGMIDWDGDATGLDDTTDWALGFAYYIGGHGHPYKIVVFFGQSETDEQSASGGSGSPTYPNGETFSPTIGDTNYLKIIFQLDW